jgi:RNA polymerase sigma factor (sigma-70 family)
METQTGETKQTAALNTICICGVIVYPDADHKCAPPTKEQSTDDVFAAMLMAEGDSYKALETQLIRCLTQHAKKLIWIQSKAERPDVVQEAVMKAVANLGKFRGDAKLSTWFTRIVFNALRDSYTANKRESQLFEDSDEASFSTIEAVMARLELEQLARGLSADEVKLLKYKLEQADDNTVAEGLGIRPITVRSRWLALRRKLQEKS